jgi:hypothetical protein
MLTAERLRELLHYDPDTGVFTWLRVKGRRVRVGALSGKANGGGYFQIGVDGRIYYAHRLAWLYVHGEWPVASIDHVNCDRCDNRLANLRPATKAQNAANARKRTDTSATLATSTIQPMPIRLTLPLPKGISANLRGPNDAHAPINTARLDSHPSHCLYRLNYAGEVVEVLCRRGHHYLRCPLPKWFGVVLSHYTAERAGGSYVATGRSADWRPIHSTSSRATRRGSRR